MITSVPKPKRYQRTTIFSLETPYSGGRPEKPPSTKVRRSAASGTSFGHRPCVINNVFRGVSYVRGISVRMKRRERYQGVKVVIDQQNMVSRSRRARSPPDARIRMTTIAIAKPGSTAVKEASGRGTGRSMGTTGSLVLRVPVVVGGGGVFVDFPSPLPPRQ